MIQSSSCLRGATATAHPNDWRLSIQPCPCRTDDGLAVVVINLYVTHSDDPEQGSSRSIRRWILGKSSRRYPEMLHTRSLCRGNGATLSVRSLPSIARAAC